MKIVTLLYAVTSLVIVVYSFGFVDANLKLFEADNVLKQFVSVHSVAAALLAGALLSILFLLYLVALQQKVQLKLISLVAGILLFAYPMFTYDLFNYILTAKVTFFWHENPYVVMPIEIPNEPNLAFTRAANKFALYGPSWLAFTWFPSAVGFNNVWASLVAFKLASIFWFFLLVLLILKVTKDPWNVAFFGLNPLVVSEILINGHNDAAMMVLAIVGLLLVKKKVRKNLILGVASFIASILVKGATVILLPLFFLNWPLERIWRAGFWLMFGVFLLAPLREELYPWYAVWFLSFASLIPRGKAPFIHGFSIALSLGLVFRHLPYIATGEYGGTGPLWRIILTITPATLYILWKGIRQYV